MASQGTPQPSPHSAVGTPPCESSFDPEPSPDLQGPLSVVDDNRKVVGALSVVGATIVKIVSKFQYYFPDFLKKIRISVNQLGFPGIPAKFREIFTEK